VPELPEVETVRRHLAKAVVGRVVAEARASGARLRDGAPRGLASRLPGREVLAVARRGKYLLMSLSDGWTLLSHLGMSGRWLFDPGDRLGEMPHVHVRIRFRDGTRLWFQDPRRFGLVRLVRSAGLERDRRLAALGPDPLLALPGPDELWNRARGLRVAIKAYLLDQRRLAGIGNIYASEILHRAGVHPARAAGRLTRAQWAAVAKHTTAVLGEAVERFGTTFSTYRTLWNEPGAYGDQLRVYDRLGKPCRRCGTPIRRIAQGARSTFYCPVCQPAKPRPA
jgi:formamidopyrimidine-DNA glycosylase